MGWVAQVAVATVTVLLGIAAVAAGWHYPEILERVQRSRWFK
jgi:hypothetical protein